jgi:uncharacterized protein (DUF2236 family)
VGVTVPAAAARRWAATQIRDRVVGADAPEKRAKIFDAPGERWFPPDAPIRRVLGDASMFVGGLRALLLQSLHPLAMAGVAEHSDYRSDPWGRLQRTAEFLSATTFGNVETAEEAIARVRRVHEHVRGVASDGTPYSAGDPHLLMWVHIAELDSFLAAYQHHGSARLTPAESDEYVRDAATVARKLGVIDPPVTVAELRTAIEAYRPELRGTPEARDAARFLLLEPPLPLPARAPYAALSAGAVALLPAWARRPLHLPPRLPVAERLAARPAGELVTRAIRWSLGGRR